MIGPYRTIREIASGGQAQIFEVAHPAFETHRALKLLRVGVESADAERVRLECRALDRLRHSNIVPVLDGGETEEGTPYFVMPLLVGETLADRLAREGALSLKAATAIAQQVLSGIGAAHRIDILHRDLKPANVFLCTDGVVRILDFGLARMLGRDSSTNPENVVGSPQWMAPEQVDGRELDARTDLYAVGLLLYEMIAGHPPFPNAVGGDEQMAAHAELAPQPLRAVASSTRALDALVARALAKDPASRPQSAAAFARQLELAVAPRRWTKVVGGAAALAALVVAGLALRSRPAATTPAPVPMALLAPAAAAMPEPAVAPSATPANRTAIAKPKASAVSSPTQPAAPPAKRSNAPPLSPRTPPPATSAELLRLSQ